MTWTPSKRLQGVTAIQAKSHGQEKEGHFLRIYQANRAAPKVVMRAKTATEVSGKGNSRRGSPMVSPSNAPGIWELKAWFSWPFTSGPK